MLRPRDRGRRCRASAREGEIDLDTSFLIPQAPRRRGATAPNDADATAFLRVVTACSLSSQGCQMPNIAEQRSGAIVQKPEGPNT